WTTSFSPSSLLGWTADGTKLLVTVPQRTPEGTYQIAIQATHQGRIHNQTIPVTVTNDDPTAKAPTFRMVNGTTVGVTSSMVPSRLTTRVEGPVATEPPSRIRGHELQAP